MGWQRVDLVVDGARAEALADALEGVGALSADLSDADEGTEREQAVYGEPGEEARVWPRCRVRALFPEKHDVACAVAEALDACGIESLEGASIDRVEDADWVELTQRQFEPIRAGERLWIVPTWHEPPRPGDVNVALDPGAAFGTGSHPTTKLCLGWLERTVHGGEAVLDYGCGSGILAIAALKLGAARALAVDIDPLALEAARFNAGRNRVTLQVLDARQPFAGAFAITVANILANPLRMLAPVLAAHTRAGGALALSGILESQADEVIAAYAPWAAMAVAATDSGWALVAGTRNAVPC